jgi:hypothetical protein
MARNYTKRTYNKTKKATTKTVAKKPVKKTKTKAEKVVESFDNVDCCFDDLTFENSKTVWQKVVDWVKSLF